MRGPAFHVCDSLRTVAVLKSINQSTRSLHLHSILLQVPNQLRSSHHPDCLKLQIYAVMGTFFASMYLSNVRFATISNIGWQAQLMRITVFLAVGSQSHILFFLQLFAKGF